MEHGFTDPRDIAAFGRLSKSYARKQRAKKRYAEKLRALYLTFTNDALEARYMNAARVSTGRRKGQYLRREMPILDVIGQIALERGLTFTLR